MGRISNMNMKQIETKHTATAINILVLLAAAFAVCRIVTVCRRCGTLYTFGLFYLLVLCGVYFIVKKALFLQEALFSVWVRILLALFFTGMQVLGLYYSITGIEERVSMAEAVLWVLCLTPLTYGAQNMLFSWLSARFRKPSDRVVLQAGGSVGTDADVPSAQEKNSFHAGRHFLCAYGVIFAGFMIPFATYYPAIMAYDVIPQLDQIRVSGYTTHHPLIHTLMLSMSLKIGELLPFVSNADRAGLAVYTILQMLIVAGGFAYVYVFLRRKGVHRYLCYFFVLCAAFYPTHGMLAISITKDTIYAVLVMLFTVFVWDMITWEEERTPGKNGYALICC